MTTATVTRLSSSESELAWAFPKVSSGLLPLGSRVLVQIRRVRETSAGGIVIAHEARETEKWNCMVAKVIELGPLAFRKRDTMQVWPEGVWCQPGDYVRVPKYGGDRIEVPVSGESEPALFVIVNDFEIIAKVTGNPLSVRDYL